MALLGRHGGSGRGTIGPSTRRSPVRSLLAPLLLAVVAAGCGVTVEGRQATVLPPSSVAAPDDAPTTEAPGIEDAEGIRATLEDASEAFRAGDPEAVAELLHDPGSSFGQRWQDRATWMQALPLAEYRLELDYVLPDLSTTRVREAHGEDVQVVHVVEELALVDVDREPAAQDLFLTMVDDGAGTWRIAGDTDAEALGFVSVDHLWDHGPVEVTRDGPVLAIHHPDGPRVGPLLDETRSALDAVDDRWPLPWPGTVPVLVPRDQDELAELLHVTYDLSNFVAFATATPVTDRGHYELTGSRILVNPGRFLDRPSETRQRIMAHELLHVASRPSAGPMVPSWLDEGVAQVLGEQRSTTGTSLVDGVAGASLALPTDGQFTVGGRDRIFLSYQLSWAFVDHLVDRYGSDDVARFYEAVGRGAVGEPGTEQWHLDRAARDVLGAPLAALVDEWRSTR